MWECENVRYSLTYIFYNLWVYKTLEFKHTKNIAVKDVGEISDIFSTASKDTQVTPTACSSTQETKSDQRLINVKQR